MSYTPRLREKYNSEIAKSLQDKFAIKSSMRVPKLEKNSSKPGNWSSDFR